MDTVDEHCSKVKLEDGRQLYFSIKQKHDSSMLQWSIILTDGDKVWNTEVSEDDLKDMAVGSSYSAEQFIELFEMAFKLKKTDVDTTLKYTLKALSAGRDCFFWSIYLPKDDKTFRLGSLKVSPLSETERVPVYCRMFDSLLSVSDGCRKEAASSRAESDEQRAVSKLALQKLEKFVTVQETAEKVLYTNFVAVLNEKKRKIRELQDQCDALKETLDQESVSVEETVTETASTTSAKRGRGRGAKTSSKRSTKPVSACTSPKKRRTNRRGAHVDFDSGDSTDVDEQPSAEMVPAPKHSKRTIESSDDNVTDVDEATEASTNAAAESRLLDTSPLPEDSTTAAELTASTSPKPEPKSAEPGCSSTNTDNKSAVQRTACDELDDLLGESNSGTKVEKSPVKRRRGIKKSVAPPLAAKTKSARSTRQSSQAANSDSLMDDLLGGI